MLCLIVAMSENNVIGINNTLPWKLSSDLKHFRQLTSGHPVIMGRNTYESIGKPLPNRQNIIITRNKDYFVEGCTVVYSLEEAITSVEGKDAFVIGGANIYQQALEYVDTLYITEVHTHIEGDAFFPMIDTTMWEEVSREFHSSDANNDYDFSFVQYKIIS